MYQAIGDWEEDEWDEEWEEMCEDAQCSVEDGLTVEDLATMYDSKEDADADLEKCKEWAAMPAEEQQSHGDKSCVQPFEVEESEDLWCSVCEDPNSVQTGAKILRCERCDYNVCEQCQKA